MLRLIAAERRISTITRISAPTATSPSSNQSRAVSANCAKNEKNAHKAEKQQQKKTEGAHLPAGMRHASKIADTARKKMQGNRQKRHWHNKQAQTWPHQRKRSPCKHKIACKRENGCG